MDNEKSAEEMTSIPTKETTSLPAEEMTTSSAEETISLPAEKTISLPAEEITSLTLEEVQSAVDALFGYLRDILYTPKQAQLDPEQLPEPFRELAQGLLFIGRCIEENRSLAKDLGRGNLDSTLTISPDNEIASGLKALQSTLKHISWQVGQVAKGDYKQHLSHAGMFSESINDMIDQLKERDKALRAEIELTQQLANDSRNTVLLLDGITKSIDELIIVVDRATHEWVYTNREPLQYQFDTERNERAVALLYAEINEYLEAAFAEQETTEEPVQSYIHLLEDEGTIAKVYSVVGYPITWMDRKSVVMKLVDVTQMQRKQEELERAAYFDTLTKAYSRHYGMLTLERWILERQEFILAFVDMDGLKYVNDTLGHVAGDEYIITTSNILFGFGKSAVISRLGGDEFMVLLLEHTVEQARADLEDMRKRLNEAYPDCEYDRSFSFGLVEVDKNNAHNSSMLLSIADESMYKDKRDRKKERLEHRE